MDYALLLGLAGLAGAFSLWCPCGYSIAETVTHTVAGTRRLRVRTILLLATAFSASVFGFGVGLLGMLAGPLRLSPLLLGGLALLALVADEIGRRWRPLKPLAVGRQVPREWGIVFSPEVVSVLYGLRLGIAPLTILASWVWWVAVIGAAFYGPWFSALVGGTFAVVRIVVSELSTACTTTSSMACRMEKVRAVERPLRIAGAVSLAFALGVAVVDSTSTGGHDEERVAAPR
jgi:hypothetical protein